LCGIPATRISLLLFIHHINIIFYPIIIASI
jgi:hypothetical protein